MTPNRFLKKRPLIYAIRNLKNDKVYVGKTKCMYHRCGQYVRDFKEHNQKQINEYLYRSLCKYGIENFEMFPLEFSPVEELAERELFWMLKLRSTERECGYNLRMDSSTGIVVSDETSEKIRRNLKAQWASGIRDLHSDKLRSNWKNNERRKLQQSGVMSRALTKWEYLVVSPKHPLEICDYKRLCELKIQSVFSNFYRKKVNTVECKGFTITRKLKASAV